jgi:hypothetical protein
MVLLLQSLDIKTAVSFEMRRYDLDLVDMMVYAP